MSQTPPLPLPVRRAGRAGRAQGEGRTTVEVIEEATAVLRRLPARGWLVYHAASMPFVWAALYFWSEMSGSVGAGRRLVPTALLLAGLYVVMKCGHAVFGDLLLSRLRRDAGWSPRLGVGQWLRLAAMQALIHATMPWVMLLASLAVLPTAWAYAFYRNASLLACGHLRGGGSLGGLLVRSLKVAHHAPRSNHALLLVLSLVVLLLWVNVLVLAMFIPQLVGILSGIDLEMNRSAGALLNTTLVAATVAVTWLLASPVFHAVYAVRCFEADAVRSGEDLLAGLRGLRLPAAMAIVAGALLVLVPTRAAAAGLDEVPAGHVEQYDAALDETLAGVDFRWRMPRDGMDHDEMGWFERGVFDFTRWLAESVNGVMRWISDFLRWLFEDEGERASAPDDSGGWFSDPANVRLLLVALLVVLVAALGVVTWRWLAMRRRAVVATAPAAATAVDLRDESVLATDLPEDEWLRLANEQLAAGDPRLALRALFLGTLARLGSHGLLAITPGKTNGMYARELGRRPHATIAIRKAFGQAVQVFDRCWYGSHVPDPAVIRQFRNHHDTICADVQKQSV